MLIDESLPRQLKQLLVGHDASTIQEMGWTGIKNGDLLRKAEPVFEVFLTADKNLQYQQNLNKVQLVIIVFPSNRLAVVQALSGRLTDTLANAKPGEVIEL